MRAFIFLLSILIVAGTAQTVHAGRLSLEGFKRAREVRKILQEVEHKTLDQMVEELEKSSYPETFLTIKEAMAKTYASLIKEQDVQTKARKEWLYSMINLNMAYLQFEGIKHQSRPDTALNLIIRSKLKQYLPADIEQESGFLQHVE